MRGKYSKSLGGMKPSRVPTDQELSESLNSACRWLRSLMDDEGSIQDSGHASLYYKVPGSLAVNGAFDRACSCLDWVASRFLGNRGQLAIPPEQEASRLTNVYDRGWLVWGAGICGRYDIAFPLAEEILEYQDRESGGFLDRAADLREGEGVQHAMTAGFAGLGLLSTRHVAAARRAGDFLINLLKLQPRPQEGLFLAANHRADGTQELLLERTSRDFVDRDGFKQRPARLGPVQVLLVRLYRLTRKNRYLDAARTYTDAVLTGRDGIYDCVESHKFLWGLAELYQVSPEDRYRRAARRIAAYLIRSQQPDGQWWGDAVGGGQPGQSLDLRLNTTCNALVGLAVYRSWTGR